MLSRIKDIFKSFSVVKSNSTLSTTDNRDSELPELKTTVKKLIRKSQKRGNFTLEEINILMVHCLAREPFTTTTFKFHDSLAKHMVFTLKSVYVISDEEHNVTDLRFGMEEILLGASVQLDVSVNDIKELMLPVHFKINPKHLH